jgi:hypothetical protein
MIEIPALEKAQCQRYMYYYYIGRGFKFIWCQMKQDRESVTRVVLSQSFSSNNPKKTLIHPLDVFVFALKSPRYFVEIHAVKK